MTVKTALTGGSQCVGTRPAEHSCIDLWRVFDKRIACTVSEDVELLSGVPIAFFSSSGVAGNVGIRQPGA